ncbi:MAG: hypothetical protein JSR54_18350 [Proteobacteria bacterium]|nr:hypothetical protein [Pseudomonadota bacterium]
MMTLTMQSGLGVSIPMDQKFMSMMQSMMTAVGAAPSDPVMPPVNPSLLAVIYAGGDPHYVTMPNQQDFATLHWKGGPARLTTEATAVTMTKELEWAKLFHRDAHFGQAGVDTFGSSQRFVGMVLATMVKMQLAAYLGDVEHYEDSLVGDYALLTAFSDGADLYGTSDQANNQGPNAAPASYPPENRYSDPVAAQQFRSLAAAQFEIVASTHPRSARDLSLGIQSVVWYAATSSDAAVHKRARILVDQWANRLVTMREPRPAQTAYRIRGLIEAGRVTGTERYLASAAHAFDRMLEGFDATYGVLRGSETLSIDDVAEIAGAFNAAQLWLGARIDQSQANAVFGTWWEGTVNLSGLEISSPALNQMKGAYELLSPPGRGTTLQNPLDYRYPTVPMPSLAGGPSGAAPVLVASVTWDDDEKSWTADQQYFDTAGAMHAADEFIWFHSDEINGFPNVSLRSAMQSSSWSRASSDARGPQRDAVWSSDRRVPLLPAGATRPWTGRPGQAAAPDYVRAS